MAARFSTPRSVRLSTGNFIPSFSIYKFGKKARDRGTVQMDYTIIFVLLSIVLVFTTTLSRRKSGTSTRLPPGPYPFPIIGNIFQLGPKPHQTLANLSKTYGPLMSLKLGSITTIVVSSPRIAKEMLQKHDLAFSGRAQPDAANSLEHIENSIILLHAGDRWRKFRKLCKEHIFASHRLDASQGLRKKVVADLLDYAHDCCLSGDAIDIGKAGHTTTLNLLSNFFFSVDLAQHNSVSSQEFKDIIWALMELGGKPNFSDFFPILQRFDLQSIRRDTKSHFEKLFLIFDKIADQRLQERGSPATASSTMINDAMDSLLNLHQKPDSELNRSELRNLLMDLFIAGTDTTSSTMEWAMSELLRNPEKMAKARSELKEVLGKVGVLEESDISKLPYLQAIVKETLRLHPPAPFLVPHKAESDVEIEGFMIPKNAQIFFNIWATGRDSNVWLEPDLFMPERFLGSEIDFKGHDFELIPFGAGRRICPGLPLAHKMLHLMLGTLLYSFDWKLEGGTKVNDLDMNDRFGFTLQKTVSLKAVPIKPSAE